MEFKEYAVDLVLHAERPLTEDQLFAVAEFAATAGNPGGTRLEATVVLDAENMFDAMTRAIQRVRAIVVGELVAVHTMTGEENDRRIAAPQLEPMGIAEIAKLLDVSKQRVFQLMKRTDFPAPFAKLACGNIWRKGDLSTFMDSWTRKPGRPWPATVAGEAPAQA